MILVGLAPPLGLAASVVLFSYTYSTLMCHKHDAYHEPLTPHDEAGLGYYSVKIMLYVIISQIQFILGTAYHGHIHSTTVRIPRTQHTSAQISSLSRSCKLPLARGASHDATRRAAYPR
eukprot:6198160-Pleurochrysis_carterae.AAC.1